MRTRLLKLMKECKDARGSATSAEDKAKLVKIMQECLTRIKKLDEDAGLTWDGVSGSTCMYLNEDGATVDEIASAITNRIQRQHLDLLRQFNLMDLMAAIQDVAEFHEGTEELGSSDVGGMVRQVIKQLERSRKVTESGTSPLVDKLRASFAGINSIDPDSPTYAKLLALLDKLSEKQLQELVDAKIKFVSGLARNRINRKKVSEAPGAETLAHNQKTVQSNLDAFDLDEGWKQNVAALGAAAALGLGGAAAMGGNQTASSGPEIVNPQQVVQMIKAGKISSAQDLQAALSTAKNKNQVWSILQQQAGMQGSSDADSVIQTIASGGIKEHGGGGPARTPWQKAWRKGVSEEYDPSYDPDYRPYQKPERNPDWDREEELGKPREKVDPKTVTISDEDGNVVLTFPSTGGFYGDLRYATSKGFDMDSGEYQINWQRDSVAESVSPDYAKER